MELIDVQKFKDKRMVAIFIDFSSAYNCVMRERIYHILELKGIMSEVEVQLLRALHSQLVYFNPYDMKNKVYF